jgi:hypothetical protein
MVSVSAKKIKKKISCLCTFKDWPGIFIFSFCAAEVLNSAGPLLFYQIQKDSIVNSYGLAIQSASAKKL